MYGLNVTAYINWIVATIAGAFLGQWITNPQRFGLDYALPAMFIGLLVLLMMSRGTIRADMIAAVSAVVIVIVVTMVSSASVGVIVATMAAAAIGMAVDKWK